ncbi:hypothetical protein BDP27DRAFT_1351901 [Rhodocollybia butyracea]|uniref:DNA (cytosine-5-)-methyltransferase n=1 Tax=Rhodocollybia butyracea TaxID=206335 RepID=A0A9P5P1E8_9AGAR|nr:hypothetical protein BDP27DRAFT_1351901 [Rhodocollybia butyracea]
MSAYLQITVLILHQGLYKCLNPDCYFMTMITNVSPTAKQSSVIHPCCRRILTVHEVACSQGFPDHFVFYAIEDSHCCIGNAVPWQLSLALEEEIKKALYRQYKQNQIEID